MWSIEPRTVAELECGGLIVHISGEKHPELLSPLLLPLYLERNLNFKLQTGSVQNHTGLRIMLLKTFTNQHPRKEQKKNKLDKIVKDSLFGPFSSISIKSYHGLRRALDLQ